MSQKIAGLHGREVLDSRGNPTVEAEVTLTDGTVALASVPSGASTGRYEAHELRDGDDRHRGLGVRRAVASLRGEIADALAGTDVEDQARLDATLVHLDGTGDKSRLGANAVLAASLACARAGANSSGVPLWQHLALLAGGEPRLPLPMVNLLSGGVHARQGLAFQDFLVVPVGAGSYAEALEMVVRVYHAAADELRARGLSTLKADEGGYGPELAGPGGVEAALEVACAAIERAGLRTGKDVALALDVAASQFRDSEGPYALGLTGEAGAGVLNSAEMVELVADLADRYPIASIEDPLHEDDWGAWQQLTRALGSRVQLVGDDLFATNPERLALGIERGAANAILVKMNQIGTITETLDVVARARHAGYRIVVSARSGETEDDALADLAVATGAGQIKVGSVAQSERLAKYNRLLRIEESLGGPGTAPFAGWSSLPG